MKIVTRPAELNDSADLARFLIEANDAVFGGLVPEHCLQALTIEESAINWRENFLLGGKLEKGEILLVAMTENDEVVGLAMAGRETGRIDFPRELSVLMVDPAWQRQGVGRRLVHQIALQLINGGINSMLVGVSKDNPNTIFYERLGAQKVGENPFDWDGYLTVELKYAWDDLSLLSDPAPLR